MEENHVIEVWNGTPTSIRELVVAFLRAVERFREQDSRSSRLDEQLQTESLAKAALTEALNWADTIDQYLAHGPRGSTGTARDPDWAARLPDEQSDLAHAFQRVRNLVHHRWWEAVAVRMARQEGVQVNQWVWAPFPRSSNEGRGRDADGDAAYHRALQGRRLLETLDELAAIFWSKRGWEISRHDLTQPGHDVGSPLVLDVRVSDPSG